MQIDPAVGLQIQVSLYGDDNNSICERIQEPNHPGHFTWRPGTHKDVNRIKFPDPLKHLGIIEQTTAEQSQARKSRALSTQPSGCEPVFQTMAPAQNKPKAKF